MANAQKKKGAEKAFTFRRVVAFRTVKACISDYGLIRFNSPNPILFDEEPYLGTMHTSDLFFLMMGGT